MRFLITGGSGFIGTNLVQKVLGRGDDVVNIDIHPPKVGSHARYWRNVSLLDGSAVSDTFAEFKPDYVLHAGGRTDLKGNGLKDYAANTTGSSNLIDAVLGTASVRRTLLFSTMLICENGYTPRDELEYRPDSAYGESKIEMEVMARERLGAARRDFVIVRPTSIWGPWFADPYIQFFQTIRRGVYVHPGRGKVRKQFGYVGNVVCQVLALLDAPSEDCFGRVFYIGDYSPYVVREWAELIQRESGARTIHTMPLGVLKIVAALGDVAALMGWRRAPLTRFRLRNMMKNNLLPFENTAKVCGPLEYSVREGIRQTLTWMDANGK